MTVTFDGVNIITNPYVPRFVKHESVPERILDLMSLAREDGSVIVAEKYGIKHIILQGIIYGSTQADLETKIDTFKELFSRKAKDLDIGWVAGTRRYVATCSSHKFDRDYFNISMCPWTADFIVPEGVGKNTSLTAVVDALDLFLDQSQNLNDNEYGFGKTIYEAQSFTTGVGITTLKEFRAYLKYNAGTEEDIICHIYLADVNHEPTGASLGNATVIKFTTATYAWKKFTFATAITLTAETEYVAVLSSAAASGGNVYKWAWQSGNVYPNGLLLYSPDSGSSWTTKATEDHKFLTYYTLTFPYIGSVTFEGSAEPKPVILISITSGWTNAFGVSFENTDNGEKLIINAGGTSISNGDKFEIDCENKTVRWYHSAVWRSMGFRGVFPHFIIGVNNYKIEAGDIIDQQYTESSTPVFSASVYDTEIHYQSFTVPQSQSDYQGIGLSLKKTGTPPANLIVTILEDLDGAPDAGSPVANASFTVAPGDVTTSLAWIFKNSTTKFSLNADKTYWIRLAMVGGSGDNCFNWEYNQWGDYPRGNAYGQSGWDFLFKLYYAGKADTVPVQILDIDYYKRYL